MRSRFGNIIKAILIRIGVITHIVFLFLSFIFDEEHIVVLGTIIFVGMTFIVIEGFYTILKRYGQDWKWGSPLIFIYITFAYLPCMVSYHVIDFNLCINGTHRFTNEQNKPFLKMKETKNGNLEVFFLVVIFARWSLPKGKITLEELSKLLLIYMSLIADILDMMKMVNNLKSSTCSYSIRKPLFDFSLSSLSICILQLCLGLTVQRRSKSIKSTNKSSDSLNKINDEKKISLTSCLTRAITFIVRLFHRISRLLEKEVWGIMFLLLAKDVPFSILRTFALIALKDCNWNQSIFFTVKNYVTIIIQLNRCYVLANRLDLNDNRSETSQNYNSRNQCNNNFLVIQQDSSPFSITSSSTAITSIQSSTNNTYKERYPSNLNLSKKTNKISNSSLITKNNQGSLNSITEINSDSSFINNNNNFYL